MRVRDKVHNIANELLRIYAEREMKTGFKFDKTSMAILKSKNIVSLCHYGWKENVAGDCANVIIAIPKSFIKLLNNYNDDEYSNWIDNINRNNYQEGMFITISTTVEYREPQERKMGKFIAPRLPNYIKRCIPKEFVKGCFIYCDNKRYLDFLSNREEALNHLTYIENPCFFDNLSHEEQVEFVRQFGEDIKSKTR